MDRKEPIKNDDDVIAYTASGFGYPYRFGQLKQDFQSKKLKANIVSVMSCRTKVRYFITIKPTQGVKFARVKA